MNVGIIGMGQFGFSISSRIKPEHSILCFDSNQKVMTTLKKTGKNPYFKTKSSLPKNCKMANNFDELKNTKIILLCIGSKALKETCKLFDDTKEKIIFVVISKGLIDNSTPYEFLKKKGFKKVVCLYGPTLAKDMLTEGKIGFSAGSKNQNNHGLKTIFKNNIHLETSTDPVGISYAAAMKNIMTFTYGLLEKSTNSESEQLFLLSRLAKECKDFSIRRGAKNESFSFDTLAWGADILMSVKEETRNKNFGIRAYESNSIIKPKKYFNNSVVESINTLSSIKPTKKQIFLLTLKEIAEGKNIAKKIKSIISYY